MVWCEARQQTSEQQVLLKVSQAAAKQNRAECLWSGCPCVQEPSPMQLLTLFPQQESVQVPKSIRCPVTAPLVLVGAAQGEMPHQLPQDWHMLLVEGGRAGTGSLKAAAGLGEGGSADTRPEGQRLGQSPEPGLHAGLHPR